MAIDPTNLSATAKQTFSEDFNGLNLWNGTTGLDTRPGWAQWPQYDSGFTDPGNGELEWFVQPNYAPTASANPFSVQNGVLTISAKPTDPSIAQYVGNQPYTSGMIDTYHEFSQTYGYFEMRAELPAGQGLWPSFWLLPEDNSWPPELDVMEMLGQYPTTLVTTVHSQVTGTTQLSATHYTTSAGSSVADMTSGFHTYGVDWEPDRITWYFDGQKVFQAATPADLNKPMYMLADLAVGGYWPGSPNAATQFPAQMQIDYIRAYQAVGPTIAFTAAGQPVSDHGTISPFASVTLGDPNVTSLTATVTQSASANGQLTDPNASADAARVAPGSYTVSGTVAQVQAALRSLVFAPTEDLTPPGTVATTGFTLTLTDNLGQTSSDSSTSVVAAARAVADDFTGGMTSGITLQNAAGQVFEWRMNGGQMTASADVGDPGASWHEVATGDFNGDGKADILLQNDSGQVWEWLMNGSQIIGTSNVANPGAAWHVAGTGDFDADGRSDVLLQNANTGEVWEWQMNGSQIVATGNVGTPGPSWHVVGTGDFNGDGRSEALLQNTDGTVEEWSLNGNRLTASSIVANPGSAWQVVGTGDFNGDGKFDILLQNAATGQVWQWQMNGAAIAATNNVGSPGPSWHVAAVGDYNGDGMADVVLQNGDGHVWQWLMNGSTIAASNDLGNAGNPGLRVHP